MSIICSKLISIFHKLSMIAYSLFENNDFIFIFCYINSLYKGTYMISAYAISTLFSCLSKHGFSIFIGQD
jgi:hypothetical protein